MAYNNASNNSEIWWKECVLYNTEYIMILKLPSKISSTGYIICCLVNILLTCSTIFLNTWTILAYWKSRELQSKISYFLVMLLSCSDLAMGTLCNTTHVLILLSTILGKPDCLYTHIFNQITLIVGPICLETLFLLNVERFINIVFPFYHRTKVTKSKLLFAATILWLKSVINGIIYPIVSKRIGTIVTSSTVSLIVILIVVFYLSIYIVGRKAAAQKASAKITDKKHCLLLHNLKLAKSCGMVVLCTVVCYIPLALLLYLLKDFQTLPVSLFLLYTWSLTLFLSASSLNTLLFFWRNEALRRGFKTLHW